MNEPVKPQPEATGHRLMESDSRINPAAEKPSETALEWGKHPS